ncbi:MAG: hypothetical protein PHN69_08190, partial [Candidatus Pacebacteria bacterium]|nr:hypothetical protein [Candidatus Paceibacterota bacterium]
MILEIYEQNKLININENVINLTVSTDEVRTIEILTGKQGAPGIGLPNGGTIGQLLAKKTNADGVTEWINQSDLSITASQISDFDTEVSNNTDVTTNTLARHSHTNKELLDSYTQTEIDLADSVSKKHDAVTVTDSTEIDFTLIGQDITASIKTGSIDETKLDTSVNASLDLADSAIQTETDPVFSNSPAANVIDSGDGSKYLADDNTYKTIEIPDGSKWEDEDITHIQPKDSKLVNVSHIDGAYPDTNPDGFLSVVDWDDITGTQTDISLSGFTDDLSYEEPLTFSTGLTRTTNTITVNESEINTSGLNNDEGFITGIDSGDVTTALGFTPENSANKAQNNGYASLDAGGKVPLNQLPSSLLVYKGVWNATTNTPTLTTPDTDKKGYVYICNVAGTQFGIEFHVGDWAIYNDSGVIEKSDNSDEVVSVNGQTGVVVLDADDISDTYTTNKFVTATQKSNWDTAYGWGNHAGLYDISGTAAGVMSSHNSAYDHDLIATALQSFTELDPLSVHLDQTTPQTTVGRFTFPDLTIGTNTIHTSNGNVLIGTTSQTTGIKLKVNGKILALD